MKTITFAFLIFASSICEAQTKVIAHKSHSGSHHSFQQAYRQNLFDINRSNFGLPGNTQIAIVDTVIAINDSMTAIKWKISNSCHPYFTDYNDLKASDFLYKTDTIFNHDVLNRHNTVESVKAHGQSWYPRPFNNPVDSVVFIGFKE